MWRRRAAQGRPLFANFLYEERCLAWHAVVVGGIVMIIIQESFVTSARGWWKNAAEPCLV